MATTTNYGWTTPDDSNLVKDGASAIRTLGSSIDTTTKNLNPSTTLGDIEYRSSTANTNARLGIGSAGQFLGISGGVPAWMAADPLTTKGDLFTYSTTDARLGVGTNGQVLVADSAAATGLAWATPSSGGLTLLSTTSFVNVSGSTVTVSSINQTYRNLFIHAYGFNPSSANSQIQINPNNGNACASAGTTAAAATNTSAAPFNIYNAAIDQNTGNHSFSCTITNYATTAGWKPMQGSAIVTVGGVTRGSTMGGGYGSTSAITSIVFSVSGANSISGGTILIYGVN